MTSNLVWTRKLTRADLDEWLNNFTGEALEVDYERHLALWLLTNFVYYNENEVQHLCRVLLREYIHHRLEAENGSTDSIPKLLEVFRKDTRYHCLGRVGESGGFISYYFRKENSLSNYDFVPFDYTTSPEVKNIVLVDDVTLSGENGQAKEYIENVQEEHFKDKNIFALTMIASNEAINYLTEYNITAIAAVTIDESQKCFHPGSSIFTTLEIHQESCEKMARHYGQKLDSKHPLGYNNSQYLFGFFYNTPDNCLPIFWSDVDGWKPIVKRYPKNYGKSEFASIGRFV
jgi:hypothetical protein